MRATILVRATPLVALLPSAVQAASWADTAPPGRYFRLQAADHRGMLTFRSGEPVVVTSYFYWYDVATGSHIRDGDGTDALTTHPPRAAMSGLTWRSPDWHLAQLQDVRLAGIDAILPVFWGEPGQYGEWSFAGLPPLVTAYERMAAAHRADRRKPAPPQIGMFYDTTTLLSFRLPGEGPEKRRRADLTTPEGRDWFYVTIRDFFSLIPPALWARIDGRPIVFLYAPGFAKKADERLFDETRRRFEADFGTDLFLVRHAGWPGRTDAWYQWGGAISLKIGDVVAALGPGYDHSAVPGRKPLVVDRDGGRFYDRQWEQLLRMNPKRRPWIVHVETWNEWHEGTDVARSEEYGDLYIRKTAKYAGMFKAGERVRPSGPFAGASEVRWTAEQARGITIGPSRGDGCWEEATVDGVRAAASVRCPGAEGVYVYFDVDDSCLFDTDAPEVEVAITYRDDGGCERFGIEYDNRDGRAGPVDGAFRPGPQWPLGRTGQWKTVRARLPEPRFANRANGGDFRLVPIGGAGRLVVREVTIATK